MKAGPNINRGTKGDPFRNLVADIFNQALDDLMSSEEYGKLFGEDVNTEGLTKEVLDEKSRRCYHHRSALGFLRNVWGEQLMELLDLDVGAARKAIKENYGWNVMKNT